MSLPTAREIATTIADALALARESQRLAAAIGNAPLVERLDLPTDILQSLKDYASGLIGADLLLSMFAPETYGLKAPKTTPTDPAA